MRSVCVLKLACVFSLLTVAIAGCSPEPQAPPDEAAPPPPPVGETATVTAADNVRIVYETRGTADMAVVFVHCWGCNRQFWREQVEPVAAAGYRVVTVDLPGHGDSGSAREQWSIPGLGADVEAVIEALDLPRVVLVGHSMGGPVSLAAASRLTERVAGIVCVDTLHNAEFEWPEGMVESITEPLRQDYRRGMESFVPQLFRDDADPEVVEWVINQAVETSDPAATIALMQTYEAWDARKAFADAGVPIRCINAARGGEQGVVTEVDINRKYADFDVVLMEGVGHYPQLERPAEFNRLLLAELAKLTAGSS